MRETVRTCWVLTRAGFRRYSAYRLATLAGLTTNAVFGLIRMALLLAAISSAGTAIGGYDALAATSYVWWSQGLLAALGMFGWSEVSDRVRSGDISVDFARPVDPQVAFFFADFGRAVLQFLVRGLPSVLIGAVLFGISVPQGPGMVAVALVSCVLAAAISFGCRYVVNLTSFWTVDSRGQELVYMVLSGFLCGVYVPIAWFPQWLQTLAAWTPFPSMFQAPIDLLSGHAGPTDVVRLLGTQLVWAVAVLTLGQVLTRAGRRVLEVQGG